MARFWPVAAKCWPLLMVVIGGIAGSLVRWGAVSALAGSVMLVVLALNVSGSLFLGLLLGQRERLSDNGYDLLGTGFAGGLTTFSTYTVDIATKLEDGTLLSAFGNGAVTPIAAVVAAGIGYRVSRVVGLRLLRRQTVKAVKAVAVR